MKEIRVRKRNGALEPYNVEKIQRQIEFACRGISGVSQSQIELGMHLELFDGITTSHIDQLAINACVNLIDSQDGHTNYQYVAGRLQNGVLRKTVYGSYQPKRLFEIVVSGVDKGLYDPALLTDYTEADWDFFDRHTNHSRDEELSYSAIKQFIDKYLVRNRSTGEIIDTPQVRYMIAAAVIFSEDLTDRNQKVVDYYKEISRGAFTLPTPQLAGLGTPTRQFSSCVLIKTDDTMDSIFASGEMVAKYSGKRAGIGFDMGRLRAQGASVRSGELKHTGALPFLKKWYGDLRCASQGGVRTSAATVNYPWWHMEFETLIVLKNNRGTDETRVRHMDYCVALNNFLFKRLKYNEPVSLFDPNDVPELYEAFYANSDQFEELYCRFEKDKSIRRNVLSAVDLVNAICTERSDTGRIYLMFVDNVINHTPFRTEIDPIYQTNLCVEILLPTQPFQRLDDHGKTEIILEGFSDSISINNEDLFMTNDGDVILGRYIDPGNYVESKKVESVVKRERPAIALCTLGSMNIGIFKRPEEMREPIRKIVRGLDNILSYQSYLSIQSQLATDDFRPLGVGITNLAYWFAQRKLKYGDPEALSELAIWMEHFSYYLIEASVDLAEERGPCKRWKDTRWAQGSFPHERSPETLNEIRTWEPTLEWELLRTRLMTFGIRNATNGAVAPVESSSVCIDSCNGVELPKDLVSVKDSRGSILVQVVPGIDRHQKHYQTMWSLDSCEPYLRTVATIAQFIDQSISANTFSDPARNGGKIDRTEFLRMILLANRWGLPTLYYNLTRKMGTKIEDEPEICEACVL